MKTEQRTGRPWIMIGVIVGVLLVIGYATNAIMKMVSQKVGETVVEHMMEKSMGDKADVDIRNGTMQVKTEEGTFSTGEEMPKDWPKDAPVYPNAEVQYSASVNPANGKAGQALILMSKDTQQQVADFYATELQRQQWTIATNAQAGASRMIAATKDTRALSVMITSNDDRTTITLGVENDQ